MDTPLRPSPLVFLFTALLPVTAVAQVYAPFTATTRALYGTVPDLATTHSLAFDSAAVVGGDSTWYPFRLVENTWMESTDCSFWGGTQCRPQTVPSFLGTPVWRTGDVLHLAGLNGATLTFDMAAAVGSTTVVYSDAVQRLEITRGADGTAAVLGVTDALHNWSLAHTDLDGAPLASPLHGAPVRIGATLGLVDLFRVDSFPLVLQPLTLVGRTAPDVGITEVDDEFIEDHQPGDVIQTHHQRDQAQGPTILDHDFYLKKIFLTRTELPTQVAYSVRTERFDMVTGTVVIDTVDLYYDRDHVYAPLPVEHFTGVSHSLGMDDHCGLALWHYRTDPQVTLGYCPEENCWGSSDTAGPPVEGHEERVAGLGMFDLEHTVVGPTGFWERQRIVYFEKDGVACGTEVVMGQTDLAASVPLHVAPNPAHDRMALRGDRPMAEVLVYDASGHRVQRLLPNAPTVDVDLSTVAPGLLHLVVRYTDGQVARATVVHP